MTDHKDSRRPILTPDEAARALADSTPALFDRFGRPLMVGCSIEHHGQLPPVYMIVDLKPDLRQQAAPGSWIMTLVSEIPLVLRQGQRNAALTMVAMPDIEAMQKMAEEALARQNAPGGAAASDAVASGPSSIILTDMDKAARETLETAPLRQGLHLVPEPAAAEPVADPAIEPAKAADLLTPEAVAELDKPAFDSLKELETMPSVGDLQSPAASTLRPKDPDDTEIVF